MKKINYVLAISAVAMLAWTGCAKTGSCHESTQVNPQFQTQWTRGCDGIIRTAVPERPEGQKHALALKTEPLKVVRVAFVGLGMRGPGAVDRFMAMKDVGLNVQIVALCDHEKVRAENQNDKLIKKGLPPATIYSGPDGYKELCKRDDIDLVYIATDWNHHVPVALYAMENGKHAAIEVPSAMSMQDCWDLINTSERTRKHCIQLENCCYDFFELNTLNMAQKGLFGEVIRGEGAYIHDLSGFWDYYWKTGKTDKLGWRLEYNKLHRGDVYATHGIGPVCQAMNIHRGDRLTTLVAMDTNSFVGKALVEKATGEACTDFQNGDHTTTLLRTAKGKVIEVQHNVMTPQPYSRKYQLTGTLGFANKYPTQGYAIEGKKVKVDGVPNHENLNAHGFLPPAAHNALVKEYQHPLITEIGEKAKKVGGHGGMDFMMDYRVVYCLQNGLPMDMDVYDIAEWCCLAELGAISMINGSAPVEVPDFTRGYWNLLKGYKMYKTENTWY